MCAHKCAHTHTHKPISVCLKRSGPIATAAYSSEQGCFHLNGSHLNSKHRGPYLLWVAPIDGNAALGGDSHQAAWSGCGPRAWRGQLAPLESIQAEGIHVTVVDIVPSGKKGHRSPERWQGKAGSSVHQLYWRQTCVSPRHLLQV